MIPDNIKHIIKKEMSHKGWQTPFYFYDLNSVQKNYQNLKSALSDQFQIYYSMKANPSADILKLLQKNGALIDISSMGEMDKALSAGFSPEAMSFVGPGKSEAELEAIVDQGIGCTIIESAYELELFSKIALAKKKNPKFCLRINPDHSVLPTGQSKNKTPSHFGLDESAALELKSFITNHPHIRFAGLHFYLQSQYLKAENIIENFKMFAEITLKFEAHFQMKFEMINFGGGFGIPYFQGQETLDLEKLKSGIKELLSSELFKKIAHASFYAESGRFISGPAGYFVTKVLYTKISHGKKMVICDGGMTQHQAAIGIGQVIRRNYPVDVLADSQTPIEKVSLAGPSCYSIDILAADIELPVLNPGDLIIIGQSGAYGASFSPQNFLSRPHAHEYS